MISLSLSIIDLSYPVALVFRKSLKSNILPLKKGVKLLNFQTIVISIVKTVSDPHEKKL